MADSKEKMSGAFAVLRDAIEARAFPGAVAAVSFEGELVALQGVGQFTYDASSPVVLADTIYDLASVTKVVATTAAAMILYERGRLRLEMPLVEVVPEFAEGAKEKTHIRQNRADVGHLGDQRKEGEQRRQVTLRMLLTHSSGLPGYVRLFEQAQGREAMLRAACSVPLEAAPGTRAEYSDIGFILLGEALQRLAGEPLDQFCQREVFAPLGMARTGFCPPAELRKQIPPTEDDLSYRHRVIQGEVQDENASAMGGVAGHAGVFAPAADVMRFAQCMMNGGAPILRPETVALFTQRDSSISGTSRALGWDKPSQPSQSGKYFSSRAFGHLGYAGTSLWIDPERQLAIVLLTNRTWPDRGCQLIKQVRPRFHDSVIEALK